MDFLRSGYKASMRLWRNVPLVAKVRWFKAAEGAKVFEGRSNLRSSYWYDPQTYNPVVGELGARTYGPNLDVNTVGYLGRHYCGPESAMRDGAVFGTDPIIALRPDGSCPCCDGPQLIGHAPQRAGGSAVIVGTGAASQRAGGSAVIATPNAPPARAPQKAGGAAVIATPNAPPAMAPQRAGRDGVIRSGFRLASTAKQRAGGPGAQYPANRPPAIARQKAGRDGIQRSPNAPPAMARQRANGVATFRQGYLFVAIAGQLGNGGAEIYPGYRWAGLAAQGAGGGEWMLKVQKDDVDVGVVPTLDFLTGDNTILTVTNDVPGQRVKVEVEATPGDGAEYSVLGVDGAAGARDDIAATEGDGAGLLVFDDAADAVYWYQNGGTPGVVFTPDGTTLIISPLDLTDPNLVAGEAGLANGGTGANLTAPGADSLMGYDDTDGSVCFITIGANLSYDHATHTLSATGGGGGGGRTEGSLAAAGTTQGTAAAITTDAVEVTGANGSNGVILPSSTTAAIIVVWNNSGFNSVNVYPNSGATLGMGMVNTPFTMFGGTSYAFLRVSSTQWWKVSLS